MRISGACDKLSYAMELEVGYIRYDSLFCRKIIIEKSNMFHVKQVD